MQPHELRINNWVKAINPVKHQPYVQLMSTGNNYVDVRCKTIGGVEGYAQAKFGDLAPIPLTPEILEKAGFEKYNGYLAKSMGVASMLLGFYAGVSDKMTLIQKTAPVDEGLYPNDRLMHFGANHPTYVHELQNLWFALTGTELEVSL